MEEVWDDINLSSLRSVDDTHKTSFRGANFQDFLARPFDKNPPAAALSSSFDTPPPPPATLLTLNSGPDQLNFFENSDSRRKAQPNCSGNAVPLNGLTSLSSQGILGAKRFADSDNTRERRHKRMMKNREAATRSRARKQAYINELELEVANLLEENARLLKQQQKICQTAVTQLPKKPNLKRTLSAPF